MTRRNDNVVKKQAEARADASARSGLDESAFTISQYVPSATMADLTEEQLDEAVELARMGAFEMAIARALGVDQGTFIRALNHGKDGTRKGYTAFAERFYAARKEHLRRSLGVINDAVDEGDWRPAAWQLERSHGFHKKAYVEHDVSAETLSLMAIAQIPLSEAHAALQIESEVIVDG